MAHFNRAHVTDEGLKDLINALENVWKQKEGDKVQSVNRLRHKISSLHQNIELRVEAATDPKNEIIRDEILGAIKKKKSELIDLEDQLGKLHIEADDDMERFLKFAFDFIDNNGQRFLDPALSDENRKRCKQIIFPAGFRMDANKNVYTPEVSPLIRLAVNKKDLPETEKSSMVRVKRL